jgi:sulfate adenylyltransferase subunit 1
VTSVKLNDIARIELRLAGVVYADAYKDNPSNGSFILIDEGSNNTVAGGFIE